MPLAPDRARLLTASALCLCLAGSAAAGAPIDRRALVSRHHPVLRVLDPESPLSVGNGEFAFTADVTGLQTRNTNERSR